MVQAKSWLMQAYVEYFQNVLGVREVLLQPEAASEPSVLLAFLSEPESWALESAPESLELLAKMLSAMKLSEKVVMHLPLSVGELSSKIEWLESLSAIVVFSTKSFDFLSNNYPRMKIYQISELSEMLKNPALKREAWETLKLVMQNIEQKNP